MLKKKKILHIITSLGDGGAEGVLYRLISETNKIVHHEVIVLSKDNKYEGLLRSKKVKIFNINLKKNKIEIKKLIKLYKLIRRKKKYLIQTWLYHADFLGGLFAYFSGNKNIYWNIRTSEISFKSTRLRTLIIIMFNSLLSWFVPKKIIICSKKSISIHRSIGFKNNFELIHNGFDTKFYLPRKNFKRQNFDLTKDQIIIGNVARYHPVKNHDYLLSIFNQIKNFPNIKLILIGTNVNKTNSQLLRKLKYYNIQDKVILLGRRDDVFHIYKLFDIFILTSKSEGFPNVLAEAMINNNICYSTDVGEASLILRRKNFIIPKDDVIKSARIIQNMINQKNSYKWKRIKKENKTHIMNSFSLKKMVINYLDVWKK